MGAVQSDPPPPHHHHHGHGHPPPPPPPPSRGCDIDVDRIKALFAKDKFTLYATDSCPYAQRTWIALLEKENDPNSPDLFDLKFVNAYDKSPVTNAEFIGVNPLGLVPSALHKGNKLYNSLLLNEYVEEAVKPSKSLVPATLEGKWKMRLFIEKNTPLTEAVLPLLQSAPNGPEAKTAAIAKVLDLVRVFESYLVGPYAMGDQFTLADIAMIPFFERLIHVGGFYTGFVIPNEPAYFKTIAWWALVNSRASVRITMADRTPASMALYPAEAKSRNAYLVELMEPYVYGLFTLVRAAWANAAPGRRLFTTEQLQKYKAEEDAKKASAATH